MLEHRDELAPAHRLVEILRVDQAADRGAEPDVGDVEQDQRQEEVRRGEAEEADEGQRVVGPAVFVGGGIDRDRERDDPGEQDRGEGDHEGQEDAIADHLGDRAVILERVAEIAVQQAPGPVQILLPQRPIEAVERRADTRSCLLRALALRLQLGQHRGEVVAGRQLDDDEHDHADRDQRRHHDQQPMHQVAEHVPPSIAAAHPSGGSAAGQPEGHHRSCGSLPRRSPRRRASLPSCANAARQISASGAPAVLQRSSAACRSARPGQQGFAATKRRRAAAITGFCAKKIGGRAAATRPRSSAPASNRPCRRSRRIRKFCGGPMQPDGRLALGQQTVERALQLAPPAEHGGVDGILEPQRGAVANHGGDIRQADPPARLVGHDRGRAWRSRRGSHLDRRRDGSEIGQRIGRRLEPMLGQQAADEAAEIALLVAVAGQRRRRRGRLDQLAQAGGCRADRRPRAPRSPPGPAAPAGRARRRWRDRRHRAPAPAGGHPAGTGPAPPRPAGRGAMRRSSADQLADPERIAADRRRPGRRAGAPARPPARHPGHRAARWRSRGSGRARKPSTACRRASRRRFAK